ncbi:MAG: DMT family transporter [Acidobacteria bacterium]|nr:DMT family transporter [Acidobacteriota bacterium]
MKRLPAILGVVAISFSAVFVRLSEVSPSTAAVFRVGYALPILMIIYWFRRHRDQRTRRERMIAVIAGVALAVDFACWHRSIAMIGAGLATVLGNTQVVFVALAAWLFHRERPNRMALAFVPVVFFGVVLISGVFDERAWGTDPLGGAIFGVLTGLTYAAFLLIFRVSNTATVAPPVGPLMDATFGALVASVLLIPTDRHFSWEISWPAHGWLLALAVTASVVGWLLISWVLPRLPALETSVILLVQPMLTVLWGWALLGEDLGIGQWIGVAVVLSGIGILSTTGSVIPGPDTKKAAERPPPSTSQEPELSDGAGPGSGTR